MYATEYSVGVFIYVVIGLILLVVYKFHRKDYVLLTAGKDILMVLGDEKSHTIVEEIEKIQESAILRNVETARSPRRRIETQGVHCMVSRTTSGYKSRGGEPA